MENKPVPLLKIIREKCLDCCCGSPVEVKLCTVIYYTHQEAGAIRRTERVSRNQIKCSEE